MDQRPLKGESRLVDSGRLADAPQRHSCREGVHWAVRKKITSAMSSTPVTINVRHDKRRCKQEKETYIPLMKEKRLEGN